MLINEKQSQPLFIPLCFERVNSKSLSFFGQTAIFLLDLNKVNTCQDPNKKNREISFKIATGLKLVQYKRDQK